MPDNHLPEDEAALYVTGELTDVERCEFEARMAGSAELRVLVRELEDGAVALTMAMPRRRPPQQVWQQIEQAVAEEAKQKVVTPLFWIRWLQNGWAAAAACLIGWFSYAMWAHRAGTPVLSPSQVAAQVASEREAAAVNSFKTEAEGAMPRQPAMTNTGRKPQLNVAAQTTENGALRQQLAELENQVTHLSEMVTQQQVLLSESSRLKFFQLAPASNGVSYATATPPSLELQRALFLAMARELGWLPSADANAGNKQETQDSHVNGSPTNFTGIDFVNLHPDTNETTHPINPQSQSEIASADTSEGSSSGSAIPGFVSGTNVFLAFGSSAAPIGSYLTVWSADGSLGTILVGGDPTVVTIPASSLYAPGTSQFQSSLNLSVTATTASGQSNGLQYSVPIPIAPQP